MAQDYIGMFKLIKTEFYQQDSLATVETEELQNFTKTLILESSNILKSEIFLVLELLQPVWLENQTAGMKNVYVRRTKHDATHICSGWFS